MTLQDHVIADAAKGSLNKTIFRPTILLVLTHTPSLKQWLKLWPAQGILSFEHVLAPQSLLIIDILSFGAACDQ
jgi:hypothetical protein